MSGVDFSQADTLPKRLLARAAVLGDAVALRQKDRGIWQEVSWYQYLENVQDLALGFAALGLERGEKVCIVGENRPEWVYAELAAQALGAAAVGVYQDSLAREMAFVIDDADARLVVVEDQEQVDKLLEVRDLLPKVERIIYYDPKGLRHYHDPLLLPFTAAQELGREYATLHTDHFRDAVAQGRGDDIAIICYTSGTTGHPKGAMLTHQNLLRMGQNLNAIDPNSPTGDYLSFLPMAWIGEQMMTFCLGLSVGFVTNFPEEPETQRENLREIGPQLVFGPPRVFEDQQTRIRVRMEDADWFKRFLYKWALRVGYRAADCKFEQRRPGFGLRLAYAVADFLVLSAIRDHNGLAGTRRVYVGGAALGPDVFRFYHALGINLKQIYGQTEITGISVIHRDGDIKFHTVGIPINETEMRISPEGEIQQQSPSVFAGYYKNPEATASTLTADGWLRTGDAGYIDERCGHLVVIDRLKDVMHLADGSLFSPQFIENKLKFSPYIKEAVAIGQDRPCVVAMINIDMASCGKWAENRKIGYTTYTDLAQKPQVLDLVRREVAAVNRQLPPAAQIRRFVVLHKELDADDEELTRTRKVRRGFINAKYAPVIEGLYDGRRAIPVQGRVRYRDGRESLIETELAVIAPEGGAA